MVEDRIQEIVWWEVDGTCPRLVRISTESQIFTSTHAYNTAHNSRNRGFPIVGGSMWNVGGRIVGIGDVGVLL